MLCGGISFLIISRLQTHTIKTYCCSCRLGKGFFFIPTLLVLIVWRNWFWFSSPHTHNWLANIVILSFHAFFGNICCFLIEQCNKSPIHQTLPHIQLPDDPAKKREKKKNLWIDPEMTHDFSRIRKLKFSFWLFDFEHFIPFRLVWLITWSVSVSTGFLASSDCRSHLRTSESHVVPSPPPQNAISSQQYHVTLPWCTTAFEFKHLSAVKHRQLLHRELPCSIDSYYVPFDRCRCRIVCRYSVDHSYILTGPRTHWGEWMMYYREQQQH